MDGDMNFRVEVWDTGQVMFKGKVIEIVGNGELVRVVIMRDDGWLASVPIGACRITNNEEVLRELLQRHC